MLILVVLITIVSFGNGCFTNKGGKGTPEPSLQPPASPGIDTIQGENPYLRFVVMADCRGLDNGINREAVTKTLESIKRLTPQPLFAVIPGDLVEGANNYNDLKSQLTNFKNTVSKYYPISFFYSGFGNHEATAGAPGEQAFEDVFSEISANFLKGFHKTAYYFDRSNTRFYMLNTNHPDESHMVSDTQLNWLKANIDPGKQHNFFFFHEPAFPTGAHVGSSLDTDRLQRDKLWKVIDSAKSPMVFCGHEHNYTRRHINSDFNEVIGSQTFKFNKLVYQVTTGTFGAPVHNGFIDKKNVDIPPVPEYHFAVVDVNESKIIVTVCNLAGKIIDRFEQ